MVTNEEIPRVELCPGVVHRVVLDLVRIGLWSDQQSNRNASEARRRQLGTTTLTCRLAAEVIHETLCVPVLMRSVPELPAPRTNDL